MANLIFGSSEKKHVTDALLHHLCAPGLQKGGDLHLFASQLTKKIKNKTSRTEKPSMHIKNKLVPGKHLLKDQQSDYNMW